MADYAEEIAMRMADRRARRRYWPEGEPGEAGSRRDRDRGRDKRHRESDPTERKASTDPKFKKKLKVEEEKLEPISEFVKKERARRHERALKAMEERRVVPKEVPLKKWLSNPDNFKRALKRGMIKQIAKHANPKSKDTEDVVTIGGSRYAKTDLYQAPLREKASEAVLKTKYGSEMWWDRNKKIVFVAAVSLVAGFMAYTVWKNKELEQNLVRQRARRHALAARPSAQHAGILAHGGGAAHGVAMAHGGALGHGGAMHSFHGQGGGALPVHHGFGREEWGRSDGWGGWGGWGGGGGWGDWNPWYSDDASWWDDSFDPDVFWW